MREMARNCPHPSSNPAHFYTLHTYGIYATSRGMLVELYSDDSKTTVLQRIDINISCLRNTSPERGAFRNSGDSPPPILGRDLPGGMLRVSFSGMTSDERGALTNGLLRMRKRFLLQTTDFGFIKIRHQYQSISR